MRRGEKPRLPAAEFTISRKRQVSWFDARQLLATGSQALAAGIVGSMSGRRELMAALEPGEGKSYGRFSHSEELWIDYVADTGDGWNATTSVFWLVGRDGLLVGSPGKEITQPIPARSDVEEPLQPKQQETLLEAGRLMILGGDQVYPTASPLAYQQRLLDPLRCARYFQEGGRDLFAIPGNHDWYDGLTTFIRLFCQTGESRRWFGGWRTQQRRSYFSIQLPHGWWLWGLDTALEDDLDPPQYDYFRAQAEKLDDGDKLILAVPAPTWFETRDPERPTVHSRRSDKLALIMEVATASGREVDIPVILTGDHHYYARHEAALESGPRHYIICGGGGAYGLGTLLVPPDFKFDDPGGERGVGERKKCFPNAEESVRRRRGILCFAFQNWAFSALLAFAHLITFWLLSAAGPAASSADAAAETSGGWFGQLIDKDLTLGGLGNIIAKAGERAVNSPGLLMWLLLFSAIVVGFAHSGRPKKASRWKSWLAGSTHALLQIAGAFLCVWLAAQSVEALFPDHYSATSSALRWAILGVAAIFLYLYSGTLFGLYLLLSHKAFRLHDQEVFSGQGVEGYRSFLRMRISAEGLHIYPVGLRESADKWKAAPGVGLSSPDSGVFSKDQEVAVPEGCTRVIDPCEPLRPHLIEGPLFIPGKTGAQP